MHRLARHTEADRNIGDRCSLVHHLEHCLITQLHKPQLHQHDDDLLEPRRSPRSLSKKAQHRQTRTLTCNTATGATVAQLPKPVPEPEHTNRSQHVHYEPGQHTKHTKELLSLVSVRLSQNLQNML